MERSFTLRDAASDISEKEKKELIAAKIRIIRKPYIMIGGPPAQTPQVKVRTLCGFLSIITYLTENSFSPSPAGEPARLLQKTM